MICCRILSLVQLVGHQINAGCHRLLGSLSVYDGNSFNLNSSLETNPLKNVGNFFTLARKCVDESKRKKPPDDR